MGVIRHPDALAIVLGPLIEKMDVMRRLKQSKKISIDSEERWRMYQTALVSMPMNRVFMISLIPESSSRCPLGA
jgi:hypothetical protein